MLKPNSPIQIAQITMFYLPIAGGQETYIDNLHRVISQHGYLSKIIQPFRTLENRDYVRKLPYIPKIVQKVSAAADWYQFNIALNFNRAFLSQHDILICHYPFHYPSVQWHERVIVLSHGVDWLEPPTTLADQLRVQAVRLCQREKPCIVANDTNFLRALGLNVKPQSHEFQQVDDRIWYIPNCVDINHFKPLNLERKKVIFVPRNIRRVRGIHLAIEAFSKLVETYSDYEMWIAGGGLRGHYYQECYQLIQRLGLKSKIRFLGSIQWQSLVQYYNQVKLTLIPTIALEGTSLSALESMACKTPVVSTDVGGLADLPSLKTAVTPEHLADGMTQILENWSTYSETQYQQVCQSFNLKNWSQAWLNVIDNIIKT